MEAHKRRTKLKETRKKAIRQEIPAEIKRRVRIVEPEGIDPGAMVKTGEDVRGILQCTPGSFYVDRIVRPVYREKRQPREAVSTPPIYQAEAVERYCMTTILSKTLSTPWPRGER
ncbi:MAG: hypothetical protein LBJ47_03275, partial [Tannerella sp.]|nr:hypothetical protein [Tannerella sp.]